MQITFDPTIISLNEILQVFFTVHDPTTLNRQGADVGTQYRSVIFYRDADQKAVAEEVIREIAAAGLYDDPIVTELAPFKAFYIAENYHQEYFKNNSGEPYCHVVIAPKVKKFRAPFTDKLKQR